MFRAAAALTILAALPALAQDQPTFTLRGTVLDATTAHPIPRALVVSADRRLATLTDAEGRFSLPIDPLLPTPIDLSLNATRPGYQAQQVQIAHLTATTPALTIRLTQSTGLSGHLSAPGLDSAYNVPVHLYSRAPAGDGTLIWAPGPAVRTDSHGDYRFLNLPPGTYTVGTSPWVAEDLFPPRTGPAQQYPATFYGATPDADSALKITLTPGQSTRADLQLHLATYYPVHVQLAGKPHPAQSVHLEVIDTDINGGLPFTYLPATNTYECWLQSGAHTLALTAQQDGLSYAELQVNVTDAPLRTAPIALTPLANIPVHINKQFAHPEIKSAIEQSFRRGDIYQPPIFLSVVSVRHLSGSHFNTGESTIQALPPGTYLVHAGNTHGYIASLSSGSTDLLRHPLILTTTPSPIDVTLRDDGPTLAATIDFGATPLPHSATVVLIPTDGSSNLVYGFQQEEGPITLENFAPGTYRAFAMTSQSPYAGLAWRDPATAALIEAHAPTFTALPNQHLTLTVPLLDLPTQAQPTPFFND